jgi:hypothetical protein
MSLVSRKAIQRAGKDERDEVIVTFRREEDNTYTKVTKIMSRDFKSGAIKEMKRLLPTEDGPFRLTTDKEDYDEMTQYEDIDGSIKYMFFKRESTVEDEVG